MNIRILFSHLFDWIDGLLPVQCVYCNRVIAKKNAKYERTQTDAIVPLCPGCHKMLYRPWDDEDEFTK
jgi:hypothetical protein